MSTWSLARSAATVWLPTREGGVLGGERGHARLDRRAGGHDGARLGRELDVGHELCASSSVSLLSSSMARNRGTRLRRHVILPFRRYGARVPTWAPRGRGTSPPRGCCRSARSSLLLDSPEGGSTLQEIDIAAPIPGTGAPRRRVRGRRRACALRHRRCALRHRACALRHRGCALRHRACALRHRACALRHRRCALRHRACALRHRRLRAAPPCLRAAPP